MADKVETLVQDAAIEQIEAFRDLSLRDRAKVNEVLNVDTPSFIGQPDSKIQRALNAADRIRKKNLIITFDTCAMALWEIVEINRGSTNVKQQEMIIKAIDSINKMYGHLAPEKSQSLNVNLEMTAQALESAKIIYKDA